MVYITFQLSFILSRILDIDLKQNNCITLHYPCKLYPIILSPNET